MSTPCRRSTKPRKGGAARRSRKSAATSGPPASSRSSGTDATIDWSGGPYPPERRDRMSAIRLGAVGYLNARPLVYGLDRNPRFDVRYDIPAECARLLHARETDLGLIPSIEHLRGPRPYMLAPGPAVTSNGPVASVAIYTRL